MIDRMISSVTKTEGKLKYSGTVAKIFGKVGHTVKVMAKSGETDPDILRKFQTRCLDTRGTPPRTRSVSSLLSS